MQLFVRRLATQDPNPSVPEALLHRRSDESIFIGTSGQLRLEKSFRRSRQVREGILTSLRSSAASTKLIGHDIFGEDPREPYQIGATSRVKIRAVTGPMCLNFCSRAESSEAVLACAISFVMLP